MATRTRIKIANIIIFSKTPEDHLKHIDEVLHLLRDSRVTKKLQKCHFFNRNIDYFGHLIAPGKWQVTQKTTKAVEALQYPTSISELRSFLGLCNVYKRFVPTSLTWQRLSS